MARLPPHSFIRDLAGKPEGPHQFVSPVLNDSRPSIPDRSLNVGAKRGSRHRRRIIPWNIQYTIIRRVMSAATGMTASHSREGKRVRFGSFKMLASRSLQRGPRGKGNEFRAEGLPPKSVDRKVGGQSSFGFTSNCGANDKVDRTLHDSANFGLQKPQRRLP